MTKMVKTGEMGGKNLVNSLYLLSKNKLVPNQKLLHAISKSISKDIHTLLPWELSLSLWSLATLRYYDPGANALAPTKTRA